MSRVLTTAAPEQRKKTGILYVAIGLNMGGVQQWIHDLCKGLDRERFRPVVCAIENTGTIGKEIEAMGVKVITLGYKRRPVRTILALAGIIRDHKIDIVHGVAYHPALYARLAGILARVPHMLTYEPVIYDHKRRQRVFLNRLLDRFTQGYLACSQGVVKQITEWYEYAPDKVELIYNAVDTGQFQPAVSRATAKERLGFDPARVLVGIVARLDPEKGHRYFFEAIRRLAERTDVQWLVVGGGRGEETVKQQAAELGVADRIIFTGFRRDLPDLLGALDIYVLPTLKEGFPITTLNAMACGCVVVVSDYPANLEAVTDGVSGAVVPMGDSERLAQAIEVLVMSEDKRRNLGESARREVQERFSLDRQIALMEGYYERILGAGSANTPGA